MGVAWFLGKGVSSPPLSDPPEGEARASRAPAAPWRSRVPRWSPLSKYCRLWDAKKKAEQKTQGLGARGGTLAPPRVVRTLPLGVLTDPPDSYIHT